MSSSARDQVARLLTLVPLLHHHDALRLDEAAATLGVSPAQLLSDLKVLFMCGLPGGYPDDLIDVDIDALESDQGGLRPEGVIRVSNADYLARPLRLTPTEATAVIVALRSLRAGAGADSLPAIDRVLAKLEEAAAAGGRPSDGSPAGGIDAEDPADAATSALAARLRTAAEAGRQLRLTYHVPSRDEISERLVDPRDVVGSGPFTYLEAWCHSAEAPRSFRLDRIAAAEVLDSPVSEAGRAAGSASGLAEGLFLQDAATLTATVHLAAPARWVVEYYPVLGVRELGEGAVEVDLQATDERWLTRLLLRLAPHARVVAPPEFTERFAAAARQTLALYEGQGRTVVPEGSARPTDATEGDGAT